MEKNELKVYLFEVTRDRKNEDGSKAEGRETVFAAYAFEGDPAPYVDYGEYWDLDGGGCLKLVAEGGRAVEIGYDFIIACLDDTVFSGIAAMRMVESLDAPGKWAEVRNGDGRNSLFRVERLGALPKIDREATMKCSDLSASQANRVRIDGVPLFPEGGAVNAGDPRLPTMVLRPNLKRELGKVWETAIVHETGVVAKVDVIDVRADCPACRMMITAETREDLNAALCAVGVTKPGDIEPDVIRGDGDAPTEYVATVVLANEVA